jgi:diacylglycerol kinase (ATP)
MNIPQPFRLRDRQRSFGYAWTGVVTLFRTQHNAWIHALATALVGVAGCLLSISADDWFRLVVAIIIVWTAEGFNTALEFLADAVTQDEHPLIKKAKDVAAGAVLIAAAGAAIIGLLVFAPYVL